ncbi:MAG: M48 family metallopeptidase [Alphaproteobacteria bacterium GM7ARS4]|nr:M48 family metallopeptidase [Alphaproteobacteria bacterium GM7ARS4]
MARRVRSMGSDYVDAKRHASVIRYKEDRERQGEALSAWDNDVMGQRDTLLRSSLLISEHVTPTLARTLNVVCDRLFIPREKVDAFIKESPEIQASCLHSNARCVLQFSSGLVNLLSAEEFSFVIGHELGHFLLMHRIMRDDTISLVFFSQMRAQEISADRLGLVAAQNLNTAMRAIMKTVSGLGDRHLHYDVPHFIAQAKKIEKPYDSEALTTTHPPMVIRCRALLWFSTVHAWKDYPVMERSGEMDTLDEKVKKELDPFVEKAVRQHITQVKDDIKLWMIVQKIAMDGRFDKDEQKKFKEWFGEDMFVKVRNLLMSSTKERLDDKIQKNVETSMEALKGMTGTRCAQHYADIEEIVGKWVT